VQAWSLSLTLSLASYLLSLSPSLSLSRARCLSMVPLLSECRSLKLTLFNPVALASRLRRGRDGRWAQCVAPGSDGNQCHPLARFRRRHGGSRCICSGRECCAAWRCAVVVPQLHENVCLHVCRCVCVRERERERARHRCVDVAAAGSPRM
jgi:hypothetical protein